ncbi:IS6 family transposase [Staphylococcus aureus]|nr:IS6 family transposase [Staphylococcus aureus]TLW81862.1 IS6 family transposase [Staphylococcus aureus]
MNYFRYKQFNKDVITVAVGYYLRYALSYRDISEILRERGVNVHHSTVYRWVQEYTPILYQIWKKKHKKLITNGVLMRRTSKYLNNLIEQDHRHIKVRKTRYQSINTAKNTLKGIECIYALYKKNRRSLQIYGFSPCHEISIMLAS